MSFTLKPANKYPTVKIWIFLNSSTSWHDGGNWLKTWRLPSNHDSVASVGSLPFYTIAILPSPLPANTTYHAFTPWHAGQKHQHISKYLLLCVFWVTGTPATWWPGSVRWIRPITVMDWFHLGSPHKPNTADILKHRK